jgi:hypothetical protein
MGLGCILSVLFVLVESIQLVKGKLDRDEQYDRIERANPELIGQAEKKVTFFALGKKSTLVFITPNYFQFTSNL